MLKEKVIAYLKVFPSFYPLHSITFFAYILSNEERSCNRKRKWILLYEVFSYAADTIREGTTHNRRVWFT